MYKILNLSGGGIKSYITCIVLKYIEKESGKKINQLFDLVVGTSAGAFLTASLDSLSASYCTDLLINTLADKLFKPNYFNLFGILDTKYNTESKCKIIKEILGEKPSTYNYNYAIVSYDLLSRKPIIFNSLEEANTKDSIYTKKYKLSDAVIASTAAPIYWDPYSLDNMLLVDGSFIANDPTPISIKLALEKERKLNDLLIVSIGTGLNTRSYDLKRGNNPFKWILPTFNILMNSQTQINTMLYNNEDLNYYNLDINLNYASDDIDNISINNIKALAQEAETLIENNKSTLNILIGQLLNN